MMVLAYYTPSLLVQFQELLTAGPGGPAGPNAPYRDKPE